MSFFIGICGGVGSGKSTLAKNLVHELGEENATVIKVESYYNDLSNIDEKERQKINFDHLEALDTTLLAEHIDQLREGKEVATPVYDHLTQSRSLDVRIIEPKPIIIIEGVLLFAFESIRKRLDYTIFRDCPENIRFNRRTEKDVQEKGLTLRLISDQIAQTVKPMHDLFVQPYRHKADFITLHNNNLYEVTLQIIHKLETLTDATTTKNHPAETLTLKSAL